MILDLFAGPGGWSEGLRLLSRSDFGIECDAAACDTRYAAGHATWKADLRTVGPDVFRGYHVEGLIASPPCQSFSAAGKRAGLTDERGELVWLPMLWVTALRPEWVALEQVPEVLPIWRHTAQAIEKHGYRTWTGILNSAGYGVPQTRRRAILIAHLDRAVTPPEPTHAEEPGGESLFGGGRERWVTMAEALGWDGDGVDRPARTVCGDRTPRWMYPANESTGNVVVVNTRQKSLKGGLRTEDYKRGVDRPSPTVTVQAGAFWCWERPATTVCADPRLSPPGYRGRPEDYNADGGYDGERSMDNAIKLTVAEALTLQSFRPDYPVQGSRTKQFEQVGNAIPPLLAKAVLGQVL